jgi:PAS domain S-box-containing protein
VSSDSRHATYQRRIETLHVATRRLIDADSRQRVADVAVEAADDHLEFPIPSVWYVSDDGDRLELVANSEEHQRLLEEAGEPSPTHPQGGWLWEIFEAGETVVRDPIPTEDLAADVPQHSAIIVPLGDHGLLSCAVRGRGEFYEEAVETATTLGRNAATVLDRLEQEAAVRRYNEFTDEILDAVDDLVFILDDEGTITRWNETFVERTGYDDAEIESMHATDLVAEGDAERTREAIETVRETGTAKAELALRSRDGGTIPHEFVGARLQNPDGEPVVAGIGRDVTERTERERELRRNKQRWRALFEHSPDAIVIHDEEGSVHSVNKQTVENLGYSRAELHEMNVTDFEIGLEAEGLRDFWAEMDVGERLQVEGRHRRSDGSTYPAEIWVTKVSVDNDYRCIALARDITERVEYEKRLMEQRDNLEVLNQVVRHDIRNDMQMVLAWTGMLEEYVDEEGRQHIERVLSSAEDAVALTKTARAIAETMLQDERDLEPTSLRKVLNVQLEEVAGTYPSARLTVEGTLPNVAVTADEMLASVFRNLLTNAIDHNDSEEPEVIVSVTDRADDVAVHVADNGPGIPDDRKEEVFGRGEKGLESEGTGVGLYLVDTLVDSYGGDVWVQDRTDHPVTEAGDDPDGSVFTVTLPKAE